MFFKRANSAEEQLLNFRNASVSHCFRNSSLTIIWNNLGSSNYKRKKEILNLEKQTHIFQETFFYINVQQNILPRTMEWLRDATNALEQEASLLNKGLKSSFLNSRYIQLVT